MVEFDRIVASLTEEKRQAVQEECADWELFSLITDPDDWKLIKKKLIDSVGGTVAMKLDHLWKGLHHPSSSSSTGMISSFTSPFHVT